MFYSSIAVFIAVFSVFIAVFKFLHSFFDGLDEFVTKSDNAAFDPMALPFVNMVFHIWIMKKHVLIFI